MRTDEELEREAYIRGETKFAEVLARSTCAMEVLAEENARLRQRVAELEAQLEAQPEAQLDAQLDAQLKSTAVFAICEAAR